MAKIRTHYDNLGVVRNADIAVIKAAYKALAQKYHPDRNPDNPDAQRIMQIINKAYEVLSDPIKRAEHDRWIDEQEKNAETNTNQSSNAYQNAANSSSSTNQSNEHASQNTHNQTNGYQRYYEYANSNQNRHSHQSDDRQESNNRQKHYDENDNREMMNKP